MKRSFRFPLFVLVALLIAGCSTFGVKADWMGKTPQEKALVFMQMYNAQYEDVLNLVAAHGGYDNLGPATKKVVDAKVEILLRAYPIIKGYNLIVEGGGTPDQQTEAMILDLLNQLIAVGIGGDA